jgi:hypothetical protein
MFCPKCRTEYVEEVKICDDCGTALVETLGVENKKDADEYREGAAIFTTNNSIEANFIKSLLLSNGIECFIDNEHLVSINILFSQAVPIKVLVAKQDETKAKEIVARYYADMREKQK